MAKPPTATEAGMRFGSKLERLAREAKRRERGWTPPDEPLPSGQAYSKYQKQLEEQHNQLRLFGDKNEKLANGEAPGVDAVRSDAATEAARCSKTSDELRQKEIAEWLKEQLG